MMADSLEDFILSGKAREVDAFWAEKGMGYYTAGFFMFTPEGDQVDETPCYTADPVLQNHIVHKLVEEDVYEDYINTHQHAGIEGWSEMSHDEKCAALDRMTNRHVILAAARAMGLEL